MIAFLVIIISSLVHYTLGSSTTCSLFEQGSIADCSATQLDSPLRYFPNLSDEVILVDLSGNELTELTMPANTSKRLSHINLNHNKISAITPFTFANWSSDNKLSELDLAYNRLITLEPNMFYGLWRLTYLQLEGNRIQVLNDYTFAPLPSLLVLSLASNTLSTVELHAFSNLTQLDSLNLDNNRIGSLDFLFPLQALRIANFSNNSIFSLKIYTFREQLQLEYLKLDQNKIVNIPVDAFYHLAKLQVLLLQNNPLEEWYSNAFGTHKEFKRLELGGHPDMKSIEGPLLPETAASSLVDLTICNMLSLESISADALTGMRKLDSLRICNNPRLTTLPPELTRAARSSLQRVYLYSNAFETLDGASLLPPPSAERELVCDLTGNPWSCTCANSWLVLATRRSANNCSAANPQATARCASPGEYVNRSVASLSLRQMGCRGRRRYLFMSVLLLAFVVSCCGLFALVIYTLRKRLARGHRSVWGSYRYGLRLATQEDADADAEPEVAIELGERPRPPGYTRPPPGYTKTAAASGADTARSTAGVANASEAKAEAETAFDSDSKAAGAGALFSVDESASASASRERTTAAPLMFTVGERAIGEGDQAMSDTTTHTAEQVDTKNEYVALKRDVNSTRYKPDGKKAVIVIHENA